MRESLPSTRNMVTDIQEKKRRTWDFPVEVSCRGFVSQTIWKVLGSLGLTGPVKVACLEKLEDSQRKLLVGCGGREKSSGRARWLLAEPDQLSRRTPEDCCGQRRNSRDEGIHLMMQPTEQWKHCI